MKDCQNNEFGVGYCLTSLECLSREPQIQCIKILGDVAEFEWLHGGRDSRNKNTISLNQKSLSNSKWLVVKENN